MRSYPKVEGILHDISLSIVSQKYLNKLVANKNESVEGCYLPEDNLVYLSKELPDVTKIHTLLHELYHVFEHHTERMDTEAKADAFAAWLIRIFKPSTIQEILKNDSNGN